ncbi:helix-turn-helix transcriptional regulator [Actinoplanes sp. TRM 88003]|uniref:Helix-turn-helix transcriptional regulator n=1 Tax=Paractinoplanes aksuensis TaxID=2939490 RepID=A0ABT1DSV0_9ACTN|nr:helix-turn-helix transcriptional regulator [Actinoplanes aksuensis]MCO8273912.1 helix-turn-helix transcriptional regulator [Actinoplanes aksuensis]
MTTDLDLGPDAQIVYRAMLNRPRADVSELAGDLGWPTARVGRTIGQLSRLSLVRPSLEEPGKQQLIHPELGLSLLLQRQEAELLERQKAISNTRMAVTRMLGEYRESRSDTERVGMQTFYDMDAVRACTERLTHDCRTELAVTGIDLIRDPGRPESATALDRHLLSNNVELRYIFLESSFNETAVADYATWLSCRGAHVRTTPQLPPRVAIYDREIALVELNPAEPGSGAVVLRGAGPVSALLALFDQLWNQAARFGEPQQDDHELTPQERAVTRLLASGSTDEVVARSLGFSVRTARRIVADLMARLQAGSRFQAGARAVAQGWLEPSDLDIVVRRPEGAGATPRPAAASPSPAPGAAGRRPRTSGS